MPNLDDLSEARLISGSNLSSSPFLFGHFHPGTTQKCRSFSSCRSLFLALPWGRMYDVDPGTKLKRSSYLATQIDLARKCATRLHGTSFSPVRLRLTFAYVSRVCGKVKKRT